MEYIAKYAATISGHPSDIRNGVGIVSRAGKRMSRRSLRKSPEFPIMAEWELVRQYAMYGLACLAFAIPLSIAILLVGVAVAAAARSWKRALSRGGENEEI